MLIPLEQPWFLLLIPLGILAVWKLTGQKEGLGFSSVTLLKGLNTGLSFLILERVLLSLFIVASAFILARPIQEIKNTIPVYKEARDISVVLDLSGSMDGKDGKKLKTAKDVIIKFVEARPQDRVALFVFEDIAYMEWPLSSDHQSLIARLKDVTGGGGTIISSGIIAAFEHQKTYGQAHGAVIIVSDGSSEVLPKEKEAIEAALGNTKLYWISIGEEEPLALAFETYLKSLGGKVYQGKFEDLDKIFSEISQLESSPVVWEIHTKTVYQFGILPLIAFLSLLGVGLVEIILEI